MRRTAHRGTIPIACQLEASAAKAQLGEWSELFASSVGGVERVSDTELRASLYPDLRGVDALVALAQREKACCGFFDFWLDIAAEGVSLQVSVPEEAVPILDDFLRCATGSPGS
ncbi:MAG: hypothetical protein ACR2KC_00120 [Acidimicrobiales bacterium]